jgi:hypothetical protein
MRLSKLSFGVAGIACTSVFALVSGARGQTIFEHLGNTDPTAEGWTQVGQSVGDITAGPLTNDLGFDAWFVDDNSTAAGSTLWYSQVPTDSQIAQAITFGWTLSIRLRVVDVLDGVDSSVIAEYADGTRRYTIDWGSDSDGDPIILLATDFAGGVFTGPSFTLQGTGGGYHLYELVFDAVAGTADLFVDGIERISDYAGHTINVTGAGKRVNWGGGQSSTTGHGNYNFVEFALSACPWDLDGDGDVFVTDLLLLLMDFGSCDSSPADFDGDGCVTVLDLLTLLGNWGPCPGSPCPWDVNGDGTVDLTDLWQVLSNLGPCDGCPEDVNGDGVVNGQDAAAVATHFGPCP